jgi:hypothetical protein
MSRQGHPLPASEEARHGEIPERLEREKGHGDDPGPAVQPAGDAVNPDGEPYRSADLCRGPESGPAASDEFAADQSAHQDRGQSIADEEADR